MNTTGEIFQNFRQINRHITMLYDRKRMTRQPQQLFARLTIARFVLEGKKTEKSIVA